MHSNKNLAVAGLALTCVVALSVILFVWPNYREAATIRGTINQLQAKIAGLDGQAQMLDQLEAQVRRARDRVDSEFKVIPNAPDLASVIRRLSQDVDRVTVIDQTFTAGSSCDAMVGGKSSMQAMPLTVDMEATFDSIFALIRNAESISRLVRVTSVRVLCKRDEKQTTAYGDGRTPLLKASIGLEAIYEPPTSGAPKAVASAAEGN